MAKTATKTKKADAAQAGITGKIQKAAESMTEKVKGYNEKYVAKNLEKGKATLKEYNEKYLVKTVEKGKDTFKEYNDKYLSKAVEKGKSYIDGPYKKLSGTMDEWLEKGKTFEKDAWKKMDGYVANGKKFMYKLPLVETVEKRVTERLNAVPAMVNLPGKGDIEKLTVAMESLNSNIESLKKQSAQ